ncbi:hypothetical protein SAMN05660831_02105 [Thiohalospira halophila DSM 15071]|uniref:Phage tail sheath protein n=1 Tax=Thiohalospira halophila DSM 15071 TaxID=1123397 RepID=A0A1I1UC01_9GAMM|nr:phage tail sheath C-terminal domain-containing protein [Thiohalospira halophila]SFD68401.1 hypothetical protein SAMN05660831_02105 [Thiohalospira halophila DSM 15071]
MAESYLHGVEVVEIDGGTRPIRTVRSSTIGIVGTAPDADAEAFPLDTPVLVAGSPTEAAKLDTVGDGAGTLPAAMDLILEQTGALVVVVRVTEGADDAETVSNIIGGTDSSGNRQGVEALLDAQSEVGFTPRILAAPGGVGTGYVDRDDTTDDITGAPVTTALESKAQQLAAMVYADGPNTTDSDAQTYRDLFGSARVMVCDPMVRVWDTEASAYVSRSLSSAAVGLRARVDADRGFWVSISNNLIYGISGTDRPIDFTLGDPNSRANLLNEKEVSTVIQQEGFRFWGGRTTSSDAKWAFEPVRRTADMVNDSILRAHMWAVDRGITKTFVEDVVEGVNEYLRSLKARGAILGGEAWADPALNTEDALKSGHLYIDFDFTPVYPAERITFRSHLVDGYLSEVIEG